MVTKKLWRLVTACALVAVVALGNESFELQLAARALGSNRTSADLNSISANPTFSFLSACILDSCSRTEHPLGEIQ